MSPAGPWQRELGEADLDAVLAIEQSAQSSPWSRQGFLDELKLPGGALHGLFSDPSERELLAYLVTRRVLDELEILDVVTAPGWRRRGLARVLLTERLGVAVATGVASVHLEVRRSNAAALALYQGLGFTVVGERRGYYRDNGEDALLMRCELASTTQG